MRCIAGIYSLSQFLISIYPVFRSLSMVAIVFLVFILFYQFVLFLFLALFARIFKEVGFVISRISQNSDTSCRCRNFLLKMFSIYLSAYFHSKIRESFSLRYLLDLISNSLVCCREVCTSVPYSEHRRSVVSL